METPTAPPEHEMTHLIGHRFPGGSYRIEHWENALLTEAIGSEPLADGLAHPAHLFHVAINGVGTSIGELFELARSQPTSVSIDYYDWHLHQPLREGVTYVLSGGIVDVERSIRAGSPTRDSFTYRIEIADQHGAPVAEVEFRWHHWRRVEEATA